MASNFAFLAAAHPPLYASAAQAEALVYTAPRAACFHARCALETAVHWLYEHDRGLELPYDHTLGALIHEQTFQDNLPAALFTKVRAVLTVGNQAMGDPRALSERDALWAVEELFHVLYWLARVYGDAAATPAGAPGAPGASEAREALSFDGSLVPRADRPADLGLAEIAALAAAREQSPEMQRIKAAREAQTEAEVARLRAQVAALKRRNASARDDHDYNEAQTRDRFIDVLLREAGWDVSAEHATEFEVQGMPRGKNSATGRGFVDYVLWGDDGLPLGLVEAKRTRHDARKGQHQAELYADCLEARFGQRPIIFFSNGYEHHIWDDTRYPPRPVQGFYKKDELALMIHRRKHARQLADVGIELAISGRSYQMEAIRRVTEGLEKKERRHLLVMATGTGKTRTAVALVDLLRRAEWAKRVLFLADRNALVIQAKRAFTEHLPAAQAVDITQDRGNTDASVVLSTYPTMMNLIDKRDGAAVRFGVGHFDLVIVDEAHRSIYQKYAALLAYFDALLVGLTATPRDEVHRDTYGIFGLEQGVPTFAYELADAIADGYLVPPRGLSAGFKFLQEGVKYAELSTAEQEEYEDKLTDEDTGALPAHVSAAALNKWLFNEDTVEQALALLMQRGIRVNGGDRLGKTIVFCRNIKHAEFVVQMFDKAYPVYRGKFAAVVHSKNDYVQSLIDAFGDAGKQPIIAVSVDMLDTGIDVPEVVNLVFFKPVRSRVKFNQMIGRGTRLCPELLGPGADKTDFLVFDLCGNIEYFEQEMREADGAQRETLMALLVRSRLEVVRAMDARAGDAGGAGGTDDDDEGLRAGLLDALHEHVASMNLDNFLVRRHRRAVEEFSERARWDDLSDKDQERIGDELAGMPNGLAPEGHEAKRFDILCYRLMVSLCGGQGFVRWRDKIRDLADGLESKASIPMVRAQMELIHAIQDEEYWVDITLPMVEHVRRRLRDLVQFVDPARQKVVYTDFTDELPGADIREVALPMGQTGFSPGQYRKKVEAYVREQKHHMTIAKVMRGQALTGLDLSELERLLFNADEVGTRAQFEQVYGEDLGLALFVRKLVGLDRGAAKQAFGVYLEGGRFTATQIRFVEMVIDYLTQNGVMNPELLWEAPFSDVHHAGVDGVFADAEANDVISIVRRINATVGAQFERAAG